MSFFLQLFSTMVLMENYVQSVQVFWPFCFSVSLSYSVIVFPIWHNIFYLVFFPVILLGSCMTPLLSLTPLFQSTAPFSKYLPYLHLPFTGPCLYSFILSRLFFDDVFRSFLVPLLRCYGIYHIRISFQFNKIAFMRSRHILCKRNVQSSISQFHRFLA